MNRGSPTEQGTRQWTIYECPEGHTWFDSGGVDAGKPRPCFRCGPPGSTGAFGWETLPPLGRLVEPVPVVPAVVDADRLEAVLDVLMSDAILRYEDMTAEDQQTYRRWWRPIARKLLKAAGLTVEGEQSEGETQ